MMRYLSAQSILIDITRLVEIGEVGRSLVAIMGDRHINFG